MKGAGSGEGEDERESKVMGVGVLFIISCFPYVLISGLSLSATSFHVVQKPGKSFLIY